MADFLKELLLTRVFISYSHKDKEFKNELVKHLKMFDRN